VIDAHLNMRPPNPLEFNPDLPAGLAEIILKCLEKEADQRFASADELREALISLGPH
jgi:hypothetical protein